MTLNEFLELTESPAEVKKLKSLSKHNSSIETYNTLIDMLSVKPYNKSVDLINDVVKDKKLKFILGLGFGGKLANVKLNLEKRNIPVKRLIPTQKEIGFEETLKYIKDGKNIEKAFADIALIKHPIVTFQGNFIIDGHHRWSEIYVTNRNAIIECVNIEGDLSPVEMLKAVQATIGSNIGSLNFKKCNGLNLLKCSKKQIQDYLKDISENALTKLKKFTGIKTDFEVIDYLVNNAISLKLNNSPILNAPKRELMPQTSKDSKLFKDLNTGVTKI